MADCDKNCGSCSQDCDERSFREELNPKSRVHKVIAVMSGKGGVGKSFVTASLAAAMQKDGFKTAVLDADITGPSIPKMFGSKERATALSETEINPVISSKGTQLMSINYLLENETDPVIWRGPLIAGVIKQFWHDVIWTDVDYMFVDMPPGTGDVPLTVFQSLPVDGIIVVATPQDLVRIIVEKATNMATAMNVPILGLVENMSYLKCPDCGKEISLFGKSHIDKIAADFGLPILAKIPLQPAVAQLCDDGKIEESDFALFNRACEGIKKA